MTFNDALRRYRRDLFDDDDVTRCTGLSVRGWRELIKIRAVATITEERGRGRVRLCDATVFKRATVIAALNRAGFSLAVSGQIAYCLPFHTLLYTICDPLTILYENAAEADHGAKLLRRIEKPKVDWFDPGESAKPDPRSDWFIEIYDGRFVGGIYNTNDTPLIFGDLRSNGATFVAWLPSHRRPEFSAATEEILKTLPYHRFVDWVADWENLLKFRKKLKLLGYEYEQHTADDPLCIAAEETSRGPIHKTTVNISLAIRKALRRYLGIESNLADFRNGVS